jgi:imidazolonepropionase-like amidohydrolase
VCVVTDTGRDLTEARRTTQGTTIAKLGQNPGMRAIRAPAAFDGERFLEGGATVLVDGERIVGVEPFGFDVPHGTEETSYDGTLLPGLIDTHVHLVADGTPGGLEAAGALGDDEVASSDSRWSSVP